MKKSSGTDLDRIDAMNDEDIDTSDIPPLDVEFFKKAAIRMPELQLHINKGTNLMRPMRL